MHQGKPIFYDEDRRRWRHTRRLLEVTGAVFTVVLVVFFLTIIERVSLPELLLPSARASRRPLLTKAKVAPPAKRRGRKRRVAALGHAPSNYDPLRVAFYVSWDPTSLASLQQHYRDIDLLVPEQLHSIAADGRLDHENDPKLAAWMQSVGVKIPTMPLLNNS